MQHEYIKPAVIPLHKMYCHNTIMKSLKKTLIPPQFFSQHLTPYQSFRFYLGTILARFFELDSIFKYKIHDYCQDARCSFLLPNTYYTQIEILKIAFTGVCGNSFLPNPVSLFKDRNGGAVEPFITLVHSYPFATFLCTPKEISVKVIFVTYKQGSTRLGIFVLQNFVVTTQQWTDFCCDNNDKKDNENHFKQQIFSKANLGFLP